MFPGCFYGMNPEAIQRCHDITNQPISPVPEKVLIIQSLSFFQGGFILLHTSCSFQKSHELFLCAVVSAYQPRPPYSYSIIDKIAPWHRRSQIRVHQFMRVRISSLKHTHDTNPHLVVYFPKMTSKLPASSGEFRKVLFTGLYSQVVLMTIPVGGDIGDEEGVPY